MYDDGLNTPWQGLNKIHASLGGISQSGLVCPQITDTNLPRPINMPLVPAPERRPNVVCKEEAEGYSWL